MPAYKNELTDEQKVSVDTMFTYHNDPDVVPNYGVIREKAKELAIVILENSPSCADRTAAIRHLSECVMTANSAIARKGVFVR